MAFTAQDVISFLVEQRNVQQVDEDTVLFSDGTIDSVGMIDLITFVENKSGIVVEQADVTLDNFDTVARIVAFVQSKLG